MEIEYKLSKGRFKLHLNCIYEKKPPVEMFIRILKMNKPFIGLEEILSLEEEYIYWFEGSGLIEKVPFKFEPFTITFQIETQDEFLCLWHRLNMGSGYMKDYYLERLGFGVDLPKPKKDGISLFNQVDIFKELAGF